MRDIVKFCKKFGGILQENLWNLKKNSLEFWEYISEILKKIGEVLYVNFGDILKKMWWNFVKSLVAFYKKIYEILRKIRLNFERSM